MINNTKKQEYVSALKKVYSTLKTVTNQIMVEEGTPRGDIGGWASSRENIYKMYKKRLTVAKDCGNGQGCVGQLSSHASGAPNGFKRLDSNTYTGNNYERSGNFYKFILSDGMQIIIDDNIAQSNLSCSYNEAGSEGMCSAIFVDVNGEKGPNMWGRDVFYFVIKEDGLHPGGCDIPSQNDCYKGGQAYTCACKVLRENAMNY